MTSMLCGLVCVVLLSGLTALAGGQQSESKNGADTIVYRMNMFMET